MENDNGGIGSAADMGSMEGSVSAEAGMGADLGNIESSMSAEHGGGGGPSAGSLDTDLQVSQPPAPGPVAGGLDLDPAVIGSSIAVMDSRVDDPGPAFIAPNVTFSDVRGIGATVAYAGIAAVAIGTGSPTAGLLTAGAIVTAANNLDAFAHATMDAQLSMGIPGAFAAESQSVTDPGYNTGGNIYVDQWWTYGGSGPGGSEGGGSG